ncbi:MAG: alanine--tRNA ligase [Candidatus Eisenbacteria bacterium]
MTLRTSTEIRQQFLDFFRAKEHEIVPSSSVVPHDDPTLLFTNAGMNQFKDVFLGTGSRAYARAADTQKCIRAGGKHNDLDDVGKDTYHHTFFEMLGNWSFGDYFKKEAISWAWELLTEVWGLEKDRLYATYFEGDPSEDLAPDEEARQLWAEMAGIDPSHIVPGNKKDNFWEMGDTGPCGPCSEIHIDLTPDKSGGHLVNQGDPRVIEIWNLVFIQFNRGSDGKLNLLPAKHVDTGMGFERVTAVLQGKKSNYDSDVFAPLFAAIQKRSGAAPYGGRLPKAGERGGDPETLVDTSYRVIGDHVRTLTFALTDGAVISNEGRGYVLRRILRRAVRYGRQYMGMTEPFLADLVDALVDQMDGAFPELRTARQGRNVEHVKEVLREEEESFGRTLDRGIKLFQEAANVAVTHASMKVSGEDAFRLHDTYGFPIDLTELMAEERGLTVDIGEYERLMEEARERARSGGTERTGFDLNIVDPMPSTNDAPKYEGKPIEAKVLGFVQDGRFHASGAIPRRRRSVSCWDGRRSTASRRSGRQLRLDPPRGRGRREGRVPRARHTTVR